MALGRAAQEGWTVDTNAKPFQVDAGTEQKPFDSNVYITISAKPMFPGGEFTYYNRESDLTRYLENRFQVNLGEKVHVVIDNTFHPKPGASVKMTPVTETTGFSHLVGVPNEVPSFGVYNVGNGLILHC